MWAGEVEEAVPVPDGQHLIVPLGSQGLKQACNQTNVRGGQAICVDKHGKQGSGQLGEVDLHRMCCAFSGALRDTREEGDAQAKRMGVDCC